MIWKRNKDDCLSKRKVAKLVSSYKLGELLQDVRMSTFNELQTWYASATKNLHLCGSWMHLLKTYILWTCLDKLWSCIFSPPTSTISDICSFASKPDNVCTHCNRDCIIFAQIFKKHWPPICCQGGGLTIGILWVRRTMQKDVCACVGRTFCKT